jgi:hypothetical protein
VRAGLASGGPELKGADRRAPPHGDLGNDQDGVVIGYVFESKRFSRIDIDTNESDPIYSLAGSKSS